MILVDATVIMYAAGSEHPHKSRSVRFLEEVASGEVEATVDVEVFQEILHRYRAIGRWPDGRHVYDLARKLFPLALPITMDVMDRARALLDEHESLSARDALHAAVAIIHSMDAICSYDRDFDVVAEIGRREP